MRIQPTRSGFWIMRSRGAAELFRWRVLSPFLITPVLFAGLVALAVNRECWLFETLRESWREPGPAIWMYADYNRTSVENLIAIEPVRRTSQLPTIDLIVGNNTLQEMSRARRNGDPSLGHGEGGDRPYFKAYFTDERGRVQRANVAGRGTYSWHHWSVKPSLRVKIKKADVAQGYRYVELTRPKDVLALRHRLPQLFAEELGVMTSPSEPVRLFINRKYFGVYLRTMRPGEPLAIRRGRMPGAFFKGDSVGHRLGVDLWQTSEPWRQFGPVTQQDTATLDRMLAAIAEDASVASLSRLATCLDMEMLAKWSAAMIVGGSAHTDAYHNHLYFLPPNQGKLEPVIWDPTCFDRVGRDYAPVDAVMHPIMDRAIRDPRWVHRRNQFIFKLLEGVAGAERLCALIDREVDRTAPDLRADAHLSGMQFRRGRFPASVMDIESKRTELETWAVDHARYLRDYLADVMVRVDPDGDHAGWTTVYVGGTVAIDATRKAGGELVADGARGTKLTLYPGFLQELAETPYAPDGAELKIPRAAPGWVAYRIEAPASSLRFQNAITGRPVAPQAGRPPGRSALRSIHPWTFPPAPTQDVELGPGTIVIDRDVHTGPLQTLTIHAGTTVRLGAGVGIYAEGKTLVLGTIDAPVTIEPAGEQPWAAFGVSGASTAGSRFEHMRVRGGSIGTNGWVRFKGMFSVYNCPDVSISHCVFGSNAIGDDAMNLAESHVSVYECDWHDARSDGLDLDMCTGRIEGCRWRDIGNDGIDLMKCRMTVVDCDFDGCGDKGASIGEATDALFVNCTWRRCDIGVEIKDGSRAVLEGARFEANRIGLHAYQKKWMFNRGGSGLLIDSAIASSVEGDLALSKRCSIELLRSTVASIAKGKRRVSDVSDINPAWQQLIDALE